MTTGLTDRGAATAATPSIEDVRAFWNEHPCGSDQSTSDDRRQYFQDIRRKRYELEPHIAEVAKFERFRDRDVLEIGCGVGTDGSEFARHGARYTGVDLTQASVQLAKENFALSGLDGRLEVANAEQLPYADESFDHVYSWGVIHHSPDTEAIVREMHRVLRPGGTACVMVYNRTSVNYRAEIMVLRRVGRYLLYPAFMPRLLAGSLGLSRWRLEGHRRVLMGEGRMTKQRWISINTDGPECPLAKVYSAREARTLFAPFERVHTIARFFNRHHWPVVGGALTDGAVDGIGKRWGWHRVVWARKGSENGWTRVDQRVIEGGGA